MQGALCSVKALAQGIGPLVYSGLFSLFSHRDGPLPYFPGMPCLGVSIMWQLLKGWPGPCSIQGSALKVLSILSGNTACYVP